MKKVLIIFALCALGFVGFIGSARAGTLSTPNIWIAGLGDNGIKKLDSSGTVQGTYSVGTNPFGVAVDSSGNVWVTNSGGNNVTKLNSSGALQGTYSVGTQPYGIAIDASGNVWVANYSGNTVTKLNSSGALQGTYNVGTGPIGIAIDASGNVWVANKTTNNVTKLNSSGALQGTYSVGNYPYGIAIDGSGNVWVVNNSGNSVTKLNSSGALQGTYTVGVTPRGVAVDASGNVWVANDGGGTVTELNSSGGLVGTYNAGTEPSGVAVDSSGNIWVANMSSSNVTKLSSSGSLLGTYSVGSLPISLGDFTGFYLQYFLLGYRLTVSVTSITVTDAGSGVVAVGSTDQMSASVLPSDATNKVVSWSVANGTGSATINSSTGLLTATGTGSVTVTATATDGSGVTGTKQITIISNDATLSNLAISSGSLSPAFASGTTSYAVNVDYSVNSLTVTPTVNQANATTTGGGASSLSVGTNNINIVVTAQDGVTTKTYSIAVTRAAAGGGNMPPEWNNLPQAPAGGFKISINGGVKSVSNPSVTLNLQGGSDTVKMAISNFSDFRDAGQENYASLKLWNLCRTNSIMQTPAICPDGTYIVYAKFYAPWGKCSDTVFASIILKNGSAQIINQPAPQSADAFTRLLSVGSIGEQVILLQNFLRKLGFFPQDIKSNDYFGPATLKAVKDFQAKYNIAKPGAGGYGQVGPNTRKKLNQLSADSGM